jgi:uncharacterized membrane protein YphA (DoxX/SURF4 family)
MSVTGRFNRRNNDVLEYLNRSFISKHNSAIAYFSFAFVFIYFGLQKPLPTISPVYEPLGLIASRLSLPTDLWVNFVGIYEIAMGTMFLFRKIRLAFWMFVPHQTITLIVLLIIPFYAFQEPYLIVQGIRLPMILDSFGAFVLKNLIFIGGFLLLAEKELGKED